MMMVQWMSWICSAFKINEQCSMKAVDRMRYLYTKQVPCLECTGTDGEDCSVCEGFGYTLEEKESEGIDREPNQLELFPDFI